MKAILQNVKTGQVLVEEIPPPLVKSGTLVVRNVCSLVSAGTEKSIMDFSNANYLKKAQMRPDLFRKVLNRIKNEGLLETYHVVRNLLDQPIQLGYSSAGIVVETGDDIKDIAVGQKVACAGVFKATHSEYVSVPRNLVVPIPNGVSMDEACFVALGAVAMQGIRLAELSLGENVVIYGIGLVGMLAAQMAIASGCRVIGLDIDPTKVALMNKIGGVGLLIDKDVVNNVLALTGGFGADKVLLCAGTKSNEPVEKTPQIIRQKGILSVLGIVSLDIPQRDFLEKEIDIRFSRSYGPGRYDLSYEEGGLDYPYGYVRWTENRNMTAFLDLIRDKRLDIKGLITHRFSIDHALEAYKIIKGTKNEHYLGIVIDYGDDARPTVPVSEISFAPRSPKKSVNIGVIGAGTFAQAILLPAFSKQKHLSFHAFCTASGVSAASMAKKYKARLATSDASSVLSSPEINAVLIATRHDTHARYAAEALEAGKAVFVEKPLAMNMSELYSLRSLYRKLESDQKHPFLMVGYNRRFSPLAQLLKGTFSKVKDSLTILYRVNAGPPSNEWIKDSIQGGGRIVGEACHFIDFMTFLTGELPVVISAFSLRREQKSINDVISVTLQFSGGSLGTLQYTSSGNSSMPKEYVEIFGGGISAQLHNFRSVKLYGAKPSGKAKYANQVKGFKQEAEAFVKTFLSGERSPISFEELFSVAQATLLVEKALSAEQKVLIEL
jgi:polar amino acid transport system substrate-binding protein